MGAWNPKVNVFDERASKDNLIKYFELNQSDALLWANSGAVLPPIRKFHKSARLTTVFPALTFLQTEHKAQMPGDILIIDFAVVIEIALAHGNQDILTDLAPKYAMAYESLLSNVPETTFNESSIIDVTSTINGLETAFDVQGKLKSKFIQIFQTRVSWLIEASAWW